MATSTTTLRHVLTQQKSLVPCGAIASRNSSNTEWPKLLNCVTIWEDFNLDNLNESYSHILDLAVPEEVLANPPPDEALAGVVVNAADDIQHLVSWNARLMQLALGFAKARLQLQQGTSLRQSYSMPDRSAFGSIPNASGRLVVDHVVGLDDFPGQNLVVGLGRPSSKWNGRKLANQLVGTKKELLWPLRQLANICKVAQTRYGYIQTNDELVACCFSMEIQEGTGVEIWKAAIMPVPWSKHGANVLTTDLALWWLCMLAMSAPEHRAIVAEEDMVRINEWETVYHDDDERGWVRCHRYSNVEEPTSPPPPPAYTTPSPGNPAAFAAGAGLHADDSFDLPADADLANFANNLDNFFNLDDLDNFVNADPVVVAGVDLPGFQPI